MIIHETNGLTDGTQEKSHDRLLLFFMNIVKEV